MNYSVSAEKRLDNGKGASRRLRRAGMIPAVIYGKDFEPMGIRLSHNDFQNKIRLPHFSTSLIALDIEGESVDVILRAVQRHPYKPFFLHADFERVVHDRPLTIKVPLKFENMDLCPAIKIGNGVLNCVENAIEVTCLPKDIPAFISVDLQDLKAGHTLHLKDLVLPEHLAAEALRSGHNLAIVTIIGSSEPEAAEEAPAADSKAKKKKA